MPQYWFLGVVDSLLLVILLICNYVNSYPGLACNTGAWLNASVSTLNLQIIEEVICLIYLRKVFLPDWAW